MISNKNLVWIDLEMTGLNPDRDVILEIATIITDSALTHIEDGPTYVIHQPQAILDHMDEWNRVQHTKSGLLQETQTSNISLAQAYQETLSCIQNFCTPKTALLCGNTVYQDRAFLLRYMPDIVNYLHYRIIDVSTIKELVRRWYPQDSCAFFEK